MKNIHLLPTNKPSRLAGSEYITNEQGIDKRVFKFKLWDKLIPNKDLKDIGYIPQNIYITNSEEIKEGDWLLIIDDFETYVHKHKGDNLPTTYHKKIILTTDQDLINCFCTCCGVQAIDDEFLEWFVKNPTCEYVEIEEKDIYKSTTYDQPDRFIGIEYKIIIPKEELKTSEEWQKQFPNTKVLDPDGWDRKNYQYSWFEEKITLTEYTTRLYKSSGQCLVTQEKPKTNLERLPFPELVKEFAEYYKKVPLVVEPKQETLEEAAEKYLQEWRLLNNIHLSNLILQEWRLLNNIHLSNLIHTERCKNDFKAGAKWQADRMYSKEDMLKCWNAAYIDALAIDEETYKPLFFEDFIKQFKKK